MHIGFTYDLRSEYLAAGYSEEETAEFDREETIEGLEGALRELGHNCDRIGNARQLIERLARGDRWDLVFNICEGLHGAGREAQVPAILDVYDIPYTFADPLVTCVCLDKALAKRLVRDCGVPTPRFLVATELADLDRLDLLFPVFAKPVAEGTGKGVTLASRAPNAAALADVCEDLLAQFRQPVLIEEYLPGREFTVGIVGSGPNAVALGTTEVLLLPAAEPGVYSYHNKENSEQLVDYRYYRDSDDPLVRRVEDIALAAWRALGCRDAGRIDLRCDAQGQPQFMEANPLAGLHPMHSDLPMLCTAIGMSFTELIGRIVDSAALRCLPCRESFMAHTAAQPHGG